MIRIDAGGWGLSWHPGRRHPAPGRARSAGAAATRDVDAHWYPGVPDARRHRPFRPPALHVVHADGTPSTRLALDDVDRSDAADGSGEHVVLTTVDELFDLTVEHHLRTHPDSGVLEQWVEVINAETAGDPALPTTRSRRSWMVPDDAEYVQFGGAGWADEVALEHRATGDRHHGPRQPRWVQPTCNAARACSVAHRPVRRRRRGCTGPGPRRGDRPQRGLGGNSHVSLDLRPAPNPAPGELRGRAPTPSERRTDSTPGADGAADGGPGWSSAGGDGVTEAFHRWSRAGCCGIRTAAARWWSTTGRRPTSTSTSTASSGSSTGPPSRSRRVPARRRLVRHDPTPRRRHPGPGDWDVDRRKLPGGLGPLTDAGRAGIRFGIWVEPEMVNPLSDPTTTIRSGRPHRPATPGAPPAAVPGPARPEVRDFEVDVVGRTLRSAPGTSYVAGTPTDPSPTPASATLPADRQANVVRPGRRHLGGDGLRRRRPPRRGARVVRAGWWSGGPRVAAVVPTSSGPPTTPTPSPGPHAVGRARTSSPVR